MEIIGKYIGVRGKPVVSDRIDTVSDVSQLKNPSGSDRIFEADPTGFDRILPDVIRVGIRWLGFR